MTEIDRNTTNIEQKVRVIRYASIFGVIAFALLALRSWGLFLLSGRSSFQLFGGIIFLSAFVASLIAFLLYMRHKYNQASWVLLAALLALGIVPSFIYSGTGYFSSLVMFSLAFTLASFVFQDRQLLPFFGLGLSSLFASQFIDTFGSYGRPLMVQPAVSSSVSLIIALVLLVVIMIRFQSFPFRVKIVITLFGFTASSILVITAITALLASQSFTQKGYSSLRSAAHLVAGTIDQFISQTQSSLEAEARLSVFGPVLTDPNPGDPARENAEAALKSLALAASTGSRRYLQAYLLLDRQGKVIFDSTGSQPGQDLSTADYFRYSIQNSSPYNSPVYVTAGDKAVVYFSAQVQDPAGKPAGVLVARYDAAVFQQFLVQNNNLVVDQSYAILIDENGLRLAQGTVSAGLYQPFLPMDVSSISALIDQGRLPMDYQAPAAVELPDLARQVQLKSGNNNLLFQTGEESGGPAYYAASDFLQSQPWTVVYVAPQSILLEPVITQIELIQLVGTVILVIALVVAYVIGRMLTAPVQGLLDTASAIASGNYVARVEVKSVDELGALSQSMNDLAVRMQSSLKSMERQVEERTRDLQRRTSQLLTAAEIGRAVSTISNINELLERSVYLISERFNFYHVGIYLIDESGRFIVLRASNSEGGKRMLARSHHLAVGQQGIIGYVTSTGRPRIALDVGADAVFFINPDLPGTRSEIALPLISGERILGALDVQSVEPGAFTNEDLSMLQVLAEFLAVSIENARVFLESQNALDAIRHSYGDLSQRSWAGRLGNLSDIGFRSLDQGVFLLANAPVTPEPDGNQKISIPIRVRDTLIGYVDANKPLARGEWTKEELDTIDALVDQLGMALESARLFENTQLLAEKERLVSDFNTRLQESLDVDTVLRTAVSELRQILGSKNVTLVLGKGGDS